MCCLAQLLMGSADKKGPSPTKSEKLVMAALERGIVHGGRGAFAFCVWGRGALLKQEPLGAERFCLFRFTAV